MTIVGAPPHPSHSLLPDDSKERIPTSGETVSYTFVVAASGTTSPPFSYVRIDKGR